MEAMRCLVRDGVSHEDVDEALFSGYLYAVDIPHPDVVIRPGREIRLGNFLLWQIAYAEFYFTPVL